MRSKSANSGAFSWPSLLSSTLAELLCMKSFSPIPTDQAFQSLPPAQCPLARRQCWQLQMGNECFWHAHPHQLTSVLPSSSFARRHPCRHPPSNKFILTFQKCFLLTFIICRANRMLIPRTRLRNLLNSTASISSPLLGTTKRQILSTSRLLIPYSRKMYAYEDVCLNHSTIWV